MKDISLEAVKRRREQLARIDAEALRASAAQEAAKAEGNEGGPSCTLVIRTADHDKASVSASVRMSEPLGKVFADFCAQRGLQRAQVTFRFDGIILDDDSTPAGADMEDDDENGVDATIKA